MESQLRKMEEKKMQPQLRRALGPLVGAFLVCLLSLPGSAAPVQGFIGFTGPGVLAFSNSLGAPGDNFIDWCPTNVPSALTGPGCAVNNNGQGTSTVGTVTGDFVVNAGGTGTILDITDNPAAPPYTFVPLGPTSIPGIVDFSGETWVYTLTQIISPNCAGATQFCTPYFKLDQGSATSNTTSVALQGIGTITNNLGEVSNFDLLLTGNFNGNLATVIAGAASPNGIFSPSWSGTLFATVAPIPEPGPFGLALLGFAAVGIGALRSRRKA
jgi:hypothetical protein